MADYTWREKSPGIWERALDHVETHYRLITKAAEPIGKQAWAIMAAVKFSFSEPDAESPLRETVQKAWIQTRRSFPAMASIATDNSKKYTTLGTKGELEQWLEETFVVLPATSATTFQELNRRVIQRPTLYVFTETRELILHFTHHFMDGEGALRILDAMLQTIARASSRLSHDDDEEYKNGSEAVNLHAAQPLSEAAKLPTQPTTVQLQKAGAALQGLASRLPSLGLPAQDLATLPGDGLRCDFSFDPEETAQILHQCRLMGLTVTQAVHAAAIVATHRLSADKTREFASFGIFGLRRYCSEPARSHPMGLHVIAWPMLVAPPYDDFTDVASKVRAFYRDLPGDDDFLGTLTPHWDMMKPALSPGAPAPLPATDPMISSLGVVDPLLAQTYNGDEAVGSKTRLRVEDFWMAANIITGNLGMHLWTWAGRLRVGCAYNSTYHTEASVVEFLTLLRQVLRDGLGIPVTE